MMRNNTCKKTLVLGIIVLFICMSIIPSSGNISKEFSFSKSNSPPFKPSNPIPFNGTINMSICPLYLIWTGGDPDRDDVYYDVYFDDIYPPDMKASHIHENCFEVPYTLTLYKTYYWQIVAWDSRGLSTEGPIWTFSTASQGSMHVNINGPTNGKVGVAYTYTFNVPYPCGYDLTYKIEWGDSSPVESIGPSPQGVEVNATHTWDKMGSYIIRAKAIDVYGHEGPWSYFEVTMPRNKETSYSFFSQFL
jgi:hypothetical protein